EARLGYLDFAVIDTAGLEDAAAESLSGRMRAKTQAAVADADAVFFLVDARTGPLPVDRSFADLLRKSGKPVILVANKCEGRAGQAGAMEAFELGLGEPVAISAEHGEGMADLYEALRAALPGQTAAIVETATAAEAPEAAAIRVAVVGRPNVGKSTLINRLLGKERLLTGPEAGITRDAIVVPLNWQGRRFHVYDTAGLRRRAKVQEKLEKLSVADALNAVRFADVVVLLIDSERPFEDQDLRIADLVEKEGRALVIAMSKADLMPQQAGAIKKLREETDHWLPQVRGVPVVPVSGLTGAGLDCLMQAIVGSYTVWNRRVPTSALNRWLAETLAQHPPPAVSGRRLKLNYITQPKTRPPTFVLSCTRAAALPDAYRRYLVNGLRECFDLPGTPIRLILREKRNPFARKK
ncbi:MAG: ribosome biogenesis GTPase Der, partial [Xanthobacteraceae bacterium]